MTDRTETIEELRQSFWYGSRSNLNFKFLKDLSDAEFGDFLKDVIDDLGRSIDDGNAERLIATAYRWQVHAYTGHLGDPEDFPHRFDDTPFVEPKKPLADARLTLVTSSGHFVAGDDPEPFGVADMSQAEAEARIAEFLREAPTLSDIPIDTAPEQLRVRHGGYPVQAVDADHQVALPFGHLRTLEAHGVIGEVGAIAHSFVGAASQLRLRKDVAPSWAERLRDEGAEAVLLVPV